MRQPAPVKVYAEPTINVNTQKLSAVDRFTYLGSILSRAVHTDDEVDTRIARANATFGIFPSNVWERRGISLETKLKVYKGGILPSLLYARETWTVDSRHDKKLKYLHMSCLRKLINIKWQDKIPEAEVLVRASIIRTHTVLKKTQLRLAGQVIRKKEERLPKKLLYGELLTGMLSQSGQNIRFKNTPKASIKSSDIDPESWENVAQDRHRRHSSVTHGAAVSEQMRTSETTRRRKIRKSRNSTFPPDKSAEVSCHYCDRQFLARIGLVSHHRTHRNIITLNRWHHDLLRTRRTNYIIAITQLIKQQYALMSSFIFYAGLQEVLGLAVDPAEHKLYFTNLANKTVEMVNVDGSGRKRIIQSTSKPYGVAVHLKRR